MSDLPVRSTQTGPDAILAAAKALVEAASPGPWEQERWNVLSGHRRKAVVFETEDNARLTVAAANTWLGLVEAAVVAAWAPKQAGDRCPNCGVAAWMKRGEVQWSHDEDCGPRKMAADALASVAEALGMTEREEGA